MPYDYEFKKGKAKDIQLPSESGKRDPRLPAAPKFGESLKALKKLKRGR